MGHHFATTRNSALITLALSALVLSACNRNDANSPPPRANDPIQIEPQASLITVPIYADLGNLAATLEHQIPRTLWAINKPDQPCVPSKKLDLGIAKINTPSIKCRIVGEVTRGALRFGGKGHEITLAIPLHAVLRAEDIGGILKRETATADAMAHAVINVTLEKDWTPRGTVKIRYDWTNTPHMEFLGQRIDFTEQADAKLKPIIAKLERELPSELAKLQVRQHVENAWASAFTTVSLNAENPPVWMRISPTELQYGGYEMDGQRLLLRLGVKAGTETFIGKRPEDPAPTPLPQVQNLAMQAGKLAFFIPVMAEYRQLEPVLAKALLKRSAKPFEVPGVGNVFAEFRKVTMYGTTGGKIAVGLEFTAKDPTGKICPTNGTVWMTALPVNVENSRAIHFEDFAISGTTDMTGGDLILKLANTPGLSATLASALAQNFENDFNTLLGKIDRAIETKRTGNLVIKANVLNTRTGRIKAYGQGLYLPVWADGNASITITP